MKLRFDPRRHGSTNYLGAQREFGFDFYGSILHKAIVIKTFSPSDSQGVLHEAQRFELLNLSSH